MNLRGQLESVLTSALSSVTGREDTPAMVGPSTRPEFGDYQANGVMAAAKKLKTDPRALAERTISAADLSDLADSAEPAGPGFINIRLKDAWIARRLTQLPTNEKLGVEPPGGPQTVVIDYSHPNLAKPMHVGHLRGTVIGDALARILEFLGHKVVRQNHVGDWGTQFGILLAYMDLPGGRDSAEADVDFDVLEQHYQRAQELFDSDEAFAANARAYVVRLQNGDPECLRRWRQLQEQSLRHCEQVYQRLGVSLERKHVRGESAYNDDLPNVVADLRAAGLLTESDGAQCVFLDQFTSKDGSVLPVIVQKSDGGYLYATTDLAAIRYRVNGLGADRILYLADARQSLHFEQVFAVARKAGFAPPGVRLEHVRFGTMLGPDGRPFRTREGGTIKLLDLLDEAVRRAEQVVVEKNPDLADDPRAAQIAQTVGIGALKYADLAQNRTSDYVFSFQKMLSLEGNTAPYMQYAYARIRSIFRKAALERFDPAGVEIALNEPAERTLGLRLLQLPETLQTVADECLPNLLCAYLYDLTVAFTGFYENCPVLQSEEPTRSGRLALCELTARIIRTSLGLLGIHTVEQM